MKKIRFARFKFIVRRNQMMCIGQKRTMRGTIYDKNRVWITLDGSTANDKKRAMAVGIVDLVEGD